MTDDTARLELAPVEVLILDSETVAAVGPSVEDTIAIVERTLRFDAQGEVQAPGELKVAPAAPNSSFVAKPAAVAGALGCKMYSYYPGNFRRGVRDSTSMMLVVDPDTGLPVAFMESTWVTNARTAALAAVAARSLAARPPERLGLVGAGGLARATLPAIGAACPSLREVRVASRTPESRRRFCDELAGTGPWELVPVELEDAIAGVDVVVSSTPQPPAPPIDGRWWGPGTLAIALDALTGWDREAFGRADRIVADDIEGVRALNLARAEPLPLPDRWDRLCDAVTDTEPRRAAADERVIVVSLGPAALDVAVASEVYKRAAERGAGTRVRLA